MMATRQLQMAKRQQQMDEFQKQMARKQDIQVEMHNTTNKLLMDHKTERDALIAANKQIADLQSN